MSGRPPKASGQHSAKQNRLLAQIQDIYTLYQQGQFAKAHAQVSRLLTKNQGSPHAHTLAAMIASATGQHDRAHYHASAAIKIDPKNTDALTTLASLHARDGEHAKAHELYQQALAIDPNHPGALSGLGSTQSQLGQYAAARKTLKAVHDLMPDLPDPLVNRALLELDTTHAHRAIEILESAPAQLVNHPAVLDLNALAHSYDDTKSPEEVFAAHQRYGSELEAHFPAQNLPPRNRDPERKLKIGYLSGDLHQHSITYFLEPIFKHTDHSLYQTHVFTTSEHRDPVTERFNEFADHWHTCHTMTLPDLVEFIKAQEIDILVELTGHFAGHKLPVFAAKPAPVQVTFIGYGNTTGLTRIDARFVDETTDPSPEADRLAAEQLVRLPGCFLCYQPPELPPVGGRGSSRRFTMGSFNNLKKLSDSTIRVWAAILNKRPDTVLLIKSSKLANAELRAELVGRFGVLGVDESRLDLRAFSETTKSHLDTYNELDLALDTFPYTGTTTTCESLVMGVPVLTLLGRVHAGRVSASLLGSVGLDEMIAESEAQYISKALVCVDRGVLDQSCRGGLRERVLGSALCEAEPYAMKVLGAYRTLWAQWCAKESKRG